MTKELKRGDVVQIMRPHQAEGVSVKRVIGLEGDTVVLDPRRRPSTRTGEQHVGAAAWDAWRGRAKVPPGHIWLEGDNWRDSLDSNYFGPVSKSMIDGRALTLIWPPRRFCTRPWEGFRSETTVIPAGGPKQKWTEGLPIELAEIDEPHLPP